MILRYLYSGGNFEKWPPLSYGRTKRRSRAAPRRAERGAPKNNQFVRPHRTPRRAAR